MDDVITDGAEECSADLAESTCSGDDEFSVLLLGYFTDHLTRFSLSGAELSCQLKQIKAGHSIKSFSWVHTSLMVHLFTNKFKMFRNLNTHVVLFTISAVSRTFKVWVKQKGTSYIKNKRLEQDNTIQILAL